MKYHFMSSLQLISGIGNDDRGKILISKQNFVNFIGSSSLFKGKIKQGLDFWCDCVAF